MAADRRRYAVALYFDEGVEPGQNVPIWKAQPPLAEELPLGARPGNSGLQHLDRVGDNPDINEHGTHKIIRHWLSIVKPQRQQNFVATHRLARSSNAPGR